MNWQAQKGEKTMMMAKIKIWRSKRKDWKSTWKNSKIRKSQRTR